MDTCMRCGTCCRKGGPSLHHEDKKILLEGHVGHQHLVTIREGELAFDPTGDGPEPIARELVKVRGRKDWSCIFFENGDGEREGRCGIYDHRLLECRLLKCWDTSDLLSVIGKDTLTRTDLMNPNDPILEVIEAHERECPYHEVETLISNLTEDKGRAESLVTLTDLARKDLALRSHAISALGVSELFELFLFGHPLFKVLGARGVSAYERHGQIHLTWNPAPEKVAS